MQKTTTWRRNFRRWSTRIFAAVAALGAYQGLPDIIAAISTSLPVWRPVLPDWGFALVTMALSVAGAWARNIKQAEPE